MGGNILNDLSVLKTGLLIGSVIGMSQPGIGGTSPNIIPDPVLLNVVVAPNGSTDVTLTVINSNVATAELSWSQTVGGTAPVLLEQFDNPGVSLPSNYFGFEDTGMYTADDLVLYGDASIDTLFFPGFVQNGGILEAEADSIHLYIYPDDNGFPAGQPHDGLNQAVHFVPMPTADPNVDTTNNDIFLDVAGFEGQPINLSAGTYWVVVAPSMLLDSSSANRWFWTMVNNNGTRNARFISPLTGNPANWTNAVNVGAEPSRANMMFSITTEQACGASWLATSPNGGMVPVDDLQEVTVTVDALGLAVGEHTANLCIDSNDVNTPRMVVPVVVIVDQSLDVIFASNFD